jgi:SPP1 family predicted phage head-tail adaptor
MGIKWTNPGRMRHWLTIEQPSAQDPDAYGEIIDVWQSVATVQAEIWPLSARQYFAAREVQSSATHRIRCHYLSGVDTSMRGNLGDGAEYYYFESVVNVGHWNRELEILGVEKVPTATPPAGLYPTGIAPLLITKLVNDANVGAIVGTRVRPIKLHRLDVYPAIVYRITNAAPLNTSGGEDPSGTETARVEVTCIGRSYADAKGLARAVRSCISGWRDETLSPAISMCHLDPEADNDIDLEPSQDAGFYPVVQEYLIDFAPNVEANDENQMMKGASHGRK